MQKSIFVYQTSNLVTGHIYVGVHETDDINDPYLGSSQILDRAVKKYGRHKFRRDIVTFLESKKDAYALEALIVDKKFLTRADVYNRALGGLGGTRLQEEARQKCSIAGKKGAATVKEQLQNPAIKLERRRKTQRTLKLKHEDDYKGTFYKRKHTAETKIKIGSKSSVHQAGAGNSQFGTCWIYSLTELRSVKIPKNNLDYWLKKGWTKGRRLNFIKQR